MFITTIDDANATTTNLPVATAATGPTVYIHLPSSTPILVLILILILIIIMIVIVILFLQAVFLPTVYFEQGGLCSCLFSFLIREGSIVIHSWSYSVQYTFIRCRFLRRRNLLLLLLPSVNHYSFHHKVIKYKYYLREIQLLFGYIDLILLVIIMIMMRPLWWSYDLTVRFLFFYRLLSRLLLLLLLVVLLLHRLLLLRTILPYTSICHHQHRYWYWYSSYWYWYW